MDGCGRWLDNVFVERLWRSLKYEEVALGPIQTRGHRQQMTQGNPTFLGSAEIGVFGKKRDYRGIEIAEPTTTVEGDADQQCDDALGDGRMSCSAFAPSGTTIPYMTAPAKYCS